MDILNVSSVEGKERKLAFRSNVRIRNYNPPFVRPSFVKLDSLIRLPRSEWGGLRILSRGELLDAWEFDRIVNLLENPSYWNGL